MNSGEENGLTAIKNLLSRYKPRHVHEAKQMTQDSSVAIGASLYKYVDIAGLRRILEGTIRFTQPSAFNDPFELLPEIVIPTDEPEGPINISFDIMAARRPSVADDSDLPEQSRASDATSRDIVQQLNSLIGILCLSMIKDSLLMWSHYADQYAGAVIEFDGSHEFFAGHLDVEYRPLRPRKHLSAYSAEHQPVPVSELCAKSDQWQYEQEVRVIRGLSECKRTAFEDRRGFPVYLRQIPVECIRSVILGERTPVVDQRDIYARVKDTKIALSLAAINHAGYAFQFERIKFDVPVSQVGPMMSPRTARIFSDSPSQRGEFARWMVEKHPLSKIVNKPV